MWRLSFCWEGCSRNRKISLSLLFASQMINQMLPSRSVYIHLNPGRWHSNWCIGAVFVSFSFHAVNRVIFLLQELRQMWKIQTFVVCKPPPPPLRGSYFWYYILPVTWHNILWDSWQGRERSCCRNHEKWTWCVPVPNPRVSPSVRALCRWDLGWEGAVSLQQGSSKK